VTQCVVVSPIAGVRWRLLPWLFLARRRVWLVLLLRCTSARRRVAAPLPVGGERRVLVSEGLVKGPSPMEHSLL
jgi:hypothetical protein